MNLRHETLELVRRADPLAASLQQVTLPRDRVDYADRRRIGGLVVGLIAGGVVLTAILALVGLSDLERPPSPQGPGSVNSLPVPVLSETQGWTTASTEPVVPDEEFDDPRSWASSVGFASEDGISNGTIPVGANTLPESTLAALPPDGIVIVAMLGLPKDTSSPDPRYPDAVLPLQLSDAEIAHSWEGQSNLNVPVYRIGTTLPDGTKLDVRVYFGSQHPGQATLSEAQAELDTLSLFQAG
ncbi:MAG: hypothetical protein ABI572_12145 [Actinomycetota bacterium]